MNHRVPSASPRAAPEPDRIPSGDRPTYTPAEGRTCLLSLPGAEAFTARLAQALGLAPLPLESRRFPDGEIYLRVHGPGLDSEREPGGALAGDALAGADAVVVAQLRDPDPQIPSLLFLADALRELGAARVGLVAPYLPYMRQDRRFLPGEAVTSTSFARLLSAAFDTLITVDPHLHRHATLGEIYRIPTQVVPSAPALARWVRAEVARPCIVGPDEESRQWVAEVAGAAGCAFTVLRKQRLGDRSVVLELPDPGALAGGTPVLVDDIIASARTMAEAVRRLRAAGQAAPVCIGVHALFAEDAAEVLAAAGAARVISTDTLPHPSNAISLAPALAAAVAAWAGSTAAGPAVAAAPKV